MEHIIVIIHSDYFSKGGPWPIQAKHETGYDPIEQALLTEFGVFQPQFEYCNTGLQSSSLALYSGAVGRVKRNKYDSRTGVAELGWQNWGWHWSRGWQHYISFHCTILLCPHMYFSKSIVEPSSLQRKHTARTKMGVGQAEQHCTHHQPSLFPYSNVQW